MSFPTSPPALAILLDMTATHVPVLAGELIELLDPQPGEIAVDCTFGGGGHARARRGPPRARGARSSRSTATRSPRSASPRSPTRRRAACASSARTSPTALEQLHDEGVAADLVYLDLGMSSMQVDTWARGFSYAYDAPLDMRMDPDAGAHRRRHRQHVGRAPARAPVPRVRRGALRPPDRPRDRPRPRPPPARDDERARRGHHRRRPRAGALRGRASRQAGLPGDPDRGQRRARPARRGAARSRGTLLRAEWPICRNFLPFAGRPAREALPRRPSAGVHLPAGPPGLRLRARARRPSCSPAARSRRRPARSPPTRAPSPPGCAPHGSSRSPTHDAARRHARTPRTARPARRRPAQRPPRRVSGPARGARAAPARPPRGGAVAVTPPLGLRLARSGAPHRRRAVPRPPAPRPRVDRARRRRRSWASSSSRSRCCA